MFSDTVHVIGMGGLDWMGGGLGARCTYLFVEVSDLLMRVLLGAPA